MSRLHLVVTGEVQGVFFRASTQERALELGLTGWVMNRADATVEIVAEGDRGQLGELLAWCRHGPPLAAVANVFPSWQQATGEFETFSIRR